MRMVPLCSTRNRRPLASGEGTTPIGESSPVATTLRAIAGGAPEGGPAAGGDGVGGSQAPAVDVAVPAGRDGDAGTTVAGAGGAVDGSGAAEAGADGEADETAVATRLAPPAGDWAGDPPGPPVVLGPPP